MATRRIKEVSDLFDASTAPDPLRLEQLKRGLQETLENLKQLEGEIMPHVDAGDVSTEVEESERVKDEIFGAMARVDRSLRSLPALSHSPAPPLVTPPPAITAKLPKLNLRNFNGSLIGWSPFWDAYKTAVHENHSLSGTEKFTYLQSLLEGRARDAIAGLALTDANYAAAIDLLQHRFGDKEKQIAAHMDSLMSLEAVTSDNNLTELRRLYDKTESNIRSLDALWVTADHYGALLTPVFIRKLPQELRLNLARKVPATEWGLNKIMSTLLEELEARHLTVANEAAETFPRLLP